MHFISIKRIYNDILTISPVIIFLSFFSCSNFNIYEIKRLDKLNVEAVVLKPASNYNELRIDVIRNIITYQTGYNNIVTEPVPYHKLGFDLGNGLFYDLNGNLCLLIDHLFNISEFSDFMIDENVNPSNGRNHKLYAYEKDSLVIKNLNTGNERLIYSMERLNDTLVFHGRNKQRFKIVERDTMINYQWKNHRPETILKVGEGVYKINRPNAKAQYKLSHDGVDLAHTYFICNGPDGKSIEIHNSKRGEKGRLLVSIIKGEEATYIYDQKGRGTKIETGDNRLLLIKPGTKTITSYELLDKNQI